MTRLLRRSVLAAAPAVLAAGALRPARADLVRHIILNGTGAPSWLPIAGGQAATLYADFAAGRYWAGTQQSGFGPWLAASGATFSRSTSGTYTSSAGTLATASSNAARFDYSPATLAPLGLLLEGGTTNQAEQSNGFSSSAWTVRTTTMTSGAATSPDGTSAGWELSAANNSFNSIIYQPISGAASSAFSVWVKPITGRYFLLLIQDTGSSGNIVFYDTTALTSAIVAGGSTGLPGFTTGANTLSSPTIAAYPNGWYRVSVVSKGAALDYFAIGASTSSGSFPVTNGPLNFDVYGAQADALAVPSSYVATTSSTATRGADSLTRPLGSSPAALSGYVSAVTPPAVGTEQVVKAFDDGTASNRVRLTYEASGHLHLVVTAGGSTQADLDLGAVAASTAFAVAYRAQAGNFAASLNGAAAVSSASGSMPTGLANERWGQDVSASANDWFGHVRKDADWMGLPLSNGALQQLAAHL